MKNVLIVHLGDVGNEGEALRQVLERMNYFVFMKNIGRPNDFIDILEGNFFNFDFLILSCHGINGEILMPVLGESAYMENEPRGNFSADDISHYFKIDDKVIVSLGCTTGQEDMAKAFSEKNTFIAPDDYVRGDSALFFAIRLFYELNKGRNINTAFKIAKQSDEETSLFKLYKNCSLVNL